MTRISRQLRSADPARGLPALPDARAERDLQTLLVEQASEGPATVLEKPVGVPARQTRAAALVTVAVAVGVVMVTVWASGLGQSLPSTSDRSHLSAAAPAAGVTCHPAQVAPFECGTYRSNYGAKTIAGNAGGPAKDPLTISFSRTGDTNLLRAVSTHCFDATIPVRIEPARPGLSQLVRAGKAAYSEGSCHGPGANTGDWAYRFLNGPLEFEAGSLGTGNVTFNSGTAMVTFQYLGATALGQTPLPRNDRSCIPAHVKPFSCGRYEAITGTGTLAFLRQHPYRLAFEHVNAELTAGLSGDCNAVSASFQPDGDTVFALPGGMTAMGCSPDKEGRDEAMQKFFTGTLTYRITGNTLTFTSPTATATFSR